MTFKKLIGNDDIKRCDTMCGRFILLTDLSVIIESFNVQNVACEYSPGSNISPG
jgi:hypothetical protein